MDHRLGSQFSRFFLGRGVAQETASADFGAGEILQQIRFAQRRMDLDVKMKTVVSDAIGRRLVQDHHVWERHLPEIVEPDQGFLQDRCKVKYLLAGQVRQASRELLWESRKSRKRTEQNKEQMQARNLARSKSDGRPAFRP